MIKRRLLKSHALIGQGLEEGYQSILLCVGEAQWMNLAWDPPPSLTSGLYTRDYNDVKALGALTNSTRTPEQTELAYFWFANYLVVWNEALRNIAGAQVFNIGESARLFALANMAMADAVITAWNTKRQYVFWRPITAIQEGDNDGNRHTAGDLSWKPLFDTPPYPDYTSGANNVTGAVTRMLRLFFGRNDLLRNHHQPPAHAEDAHVSPLHGGGLECGHCPSLRGHPFPFRGHKVARSQGEDVAKWAFKHFLRPVDAKDDDDDDGDNGHEHEDDEGQN